MQRVWQAAAVAVALCALPAPVRSAEPFAYDRAAPLHARFDAPAVGGTSATRTVRFDGGSFGEVTGTLIEPAQPGATHAAVLWVHWLGDPPTTNRTEFAADAQTLASRGVASLLIDALWARPKWYQSRRPDGDAAAIAAQVVAIRRALDLLVAQPGTDPARVAYVGHDFGAMTGALAAAVDSRIRYAVFMTPSPTFWEWMLYATPPADPGAYVTQLSAYDLPRWVPRATFAASLWQFAKNDPYVAAYTPAAAKAWIPNRDRTVTSYDAGHDLASPTATEDRRTWLLAHLTSS